MSLIFNVFPDYVCSNFIPNTSDKVAIVPQFSSLKLLTHFGEFSKYFTGGYTFHYLNLILQQHLKEWFLLRLSTIVWLVLILGCILTVTVFLDIHTLF